MLIDSQKEASPIMHADREDGSPYFATPLQEPIPFPQT